MTASGPAPGMDDAVAVDFGDDGLVPAVAQDADTGEVLMLAYADREAVAATLETGRAHYHSRSRDELWEKGATSGNVQSVTEVRVDCDADAVLYRVEQSGGACHTGQRSCFHRAVEGVADGTADGDDGNHGEGGDELVLAVEDVGEEVFDPDAVYD
jgi:phosphoribosyl-AMP cyclohydrolase